MSNTGDKNVLDRMTSKVLGKLSKIPHRNEGKDKPDTDTILDENKQLQRQVEQMRRKLNRVEKELDVSTRREGIEKGKKEDAEGKLDKLKDDVQKKERYIVKVENDAEKVKKEMKILKDEVKDLRERDKRLRKEGKHIDEIKEDNKRLIKELDIINENIKKEKKEYNDYILTLKGTIRGEKKARKKDLKMLKQERDETQRLGLRYKSRDKEVEELEKQNKELRDRLNKVGSELSNSRDGMRGRLNWVRGNIRNITEEDYKIIEDIYKGYKEIKEKKVNKATVLGEDIGYVIEEGSKKYFISLEGVKAGTIENERYFSVQDGTVCRVDVLDGNKVRIKEVYKTYDNRRKEWTKAKKERVDRVKKESKQKVNLGEDFFDEVHKYETLIITSKNVRTIRDYFYRYGVINVIEPYGEGIRKVRTEINKADIVIVRTDAVSHDITNFLKDEHKEKTVFIYNARGKDIATEIYKKAKEITEES